MVSCGGTTVNRDNTGSFTTETAWSDSGGGDSLYESVPSYQDNVTSVKNLVGSFRGTPDLALDSDPNSGVSVYDSTPYHGLSGWFVLGGTSVAAPVWAGIINAAGRFSTSSSAELTTVYSNIGTGNFNDITQGVCGPNLSYLTASGWDFCTGVGSDVANQGK